MIASVVVALTAIAATGCATHKLSQPIPDMQGRLSVKISNEPLSKMSELPLGVYQIPDTSVYVSGHQSGTGVGILFYGLIGAAVMHAVDKSTGEKTTQDVQAQLRLDIAKSTEKVLVEELTRRADAKRFAPAGSSGDGSLEIVPYLVLNFIDDDQVRPWVVLKTRLKNARGEEKWKTNYIAGVGEVRSLGGDRGWASNDSEPLRNAVDRNLRLAIGTLLRDASGTLPRGNGRMVKVTAQWVWVKQLLEMTAEVLDETEETLVVVPKVADAYLFGGVNILDKKAVTVTAERK